MCGVFERKQMGLLKSLKYHFAVLGTRYIYRIYSVGAPWEDYANEVLNKRIDNNRTNG